MTLKEYSRRSMLKAIVPQLSRAELFENPRCFIKGVRATLLALGYSEDFVEGEFREYLEKYYDVSSTVFFL